MLETIENLNQQVDYLTKKLFGRSSEKTKDCAGQLNLFDEAEQEASEAFGFDDDDSVTVQTVAAGDLNATVRNAPGMNREDLQIIQTQQNGVKRYQWVWATGGENGVQVGRGCVLDDGYYHYVLTVLADEEAVGQVQSAWKEIFSSFRLADEREQVSTGS